MTKKCRLTIADLYKISFVKKARIGLFALCIKTYGCLFNNVFYTRKGIISYIFNNVKDNCY